MTGAMYAAIAGLKTHMTKMSVIGNNIANVNTAGYKSQRTIFKDAMYSMYSSGSDGTSTTAGRNPSQIGYGSQVSSIDLNMVTGSFAPGTSTDCMIYGDGFFMVGDKDTANYIDPENPESTKALNLTRVGDFSFKADGYLSDGSGGVVYGFLCTGIKNGEPEISDQLVPIRLPRMEKVLDENGKEIYEIRYPVDTDPQAQDANAAAIPLRDYDPAKDAVDENGNAAADDDAVQSVDLPFAQLDSVSIDSETGAITGTTKDTDELITIGYIAIGNVTNPNGLTHAGGFYYTASDGAGDLQVSLLGGVAADLGLSYVNKSRIPADALNGEGEDAVQLSDKMAIGSAGGTNLMTGGLEGSNVDLANEIAEMITTQRGYQANTRIITVTDAMLEELVNMKR